jgi:dTDP-4-amino-4,6-dideoxygalactose transaminase
VIGPAWLRHFGAFAGLPRCRFLQIDGRNALLERRVMAEQIRSEHRAENHPVYLVQAGPLSVWLILTLAELANATFIDLGIVMDLASMTRLKRSGWGAYARGEMAACIRAVNPGWPDDPRAHDPDTTPDQRSIAWKRFSGGILPEIAAIAGLPERTSGLGSFDRPALGGPERARFVEEKRIDWQRVHEILELSRRANQWTNSGPVSHALERAIEFILHLPPERAVVACASASVGLTTLAGLHAVRRGRPLRWLVSAYTFAVQRTGIFADATIVDCDDHALLDLDQAARVHDGQWDGMVVTNVFASLRDLNRFTDFCGARGKALIVDSAGAMFGIDRRDPRMPAEAISFHHTKPWGVGEGGCIIVDRADVPLVRAALNFGIGGPQELRRFSGNGKISEASCALILDRLERLPGWRTFYMGQRNRIRTLARREGLRLLCKTSRDAVVASIPVLAPRPIGAGDLAGRPFDLGKYYPPLSEGFPNAARIFGHIVNVPCHAGMAAISKQTMVSVLRGFAETRPGMEMGQAGRDRRAQDIEGERPAVPGPMIGVGGLMQRVAGRLMGFGRSGT